MSLVPPTCSTNCNNAAVSGSDCSVLGCHCQSPYSDKYLACVEAACPSSSDVQKWRDFLEQYCAPYGGFIVNATGSKAATATAAIATATTAGTNEFVITPSTLVTFISASRSSSSSISSGSASSSSSTSSGTTSAANQITPSSPATTPHSAASSNNGLSSGAKAGIGAGVGVGVLIALVLGGILFVLWRRGRQRPTTAPAQETAQIQQPPSQAPHTAAAAFGDGQAVLGHTAPPVHAFPKYSLDGSVHEVAVDELPSEGGGHTQGHGHGESTILGR